LYNTNEIIMESLEAIKLDLDLDYSISANQNIAEWVEIKIEEDYQDNDTSIFLNELGMKGMANSIEYFKEVIIESFEENKKRIQFSL